MAWRNGQTVYLADIIENNEDLGEPRSAARTHTEALTVSRRRRERGVVKFNVGRRVFYESGRPTTYELFATDREASERAVAQRTAWVNAGGG